MPLLDCGLAKTQLDADQIEKLDTCRKIAKTMARIRNGTAPLHHHVDSTILDDMIFLLPIFSAFVLSIFSFLNPQSRWRNLRNCACSLESLTWLYRTRVGPFTVHTGNRNSPEETLVVMLNDWRDNLVEGSDLNMTTIEQKHGIHSPIWRHYQYTGQLGDPVGYWYGRWAKYLWEQALGIFECELTFAWCRCFRKWQVARAIAKYLWEQALGI